MLNLNCKLTEIMKEIMKYYFYKKLNSFTFYIKLNKYNCTIYLKKIFILITI